jgi:hypothetical protein
MDRTEFQIGDCVRLSDIGRRKSRTPERRGHIVARAKKSRSQWQVLWSGLKRAQFIHSSHLERCEKTRIARPCRGSGTRRSKARAVPVHRTGGFLQDAAWCRLKSRWGGSSNRISNGFDITQRSDHALVLPSPKQAARLGLSPLCCYAGKALTVRRSGLCRLR